MTKIPWTNETWSPVVGCTKIAAGCKNCYAEKMAIRLKAIAEGDLRKKSIQPYKDVISDIDLSQGWNGNVICREDVLEKPLHWKKPRKVFVCSMGDLFHEKVPFHFIDRVFCTMPYCKQHTFQVLTKRINRVWEYIKSGHPASWWPMPNCWLGASISTQADADKNIPILLQIPAALRFVSVEPLLPNRIDIYDSLIPIHLPDGNLNDDEVYHEVSLDWVIIGCESGPGARLCSLDDIRYVRDQCIEAGVPVFIKQIPLNGKCNKNPEEWPKEFQIQVYPKENNV